ncbi:MAG: dihydrofolate reductase [Hyphomicrobium sp.]|nr:dihydrofolate reductase [Hyphomicrobium sp.]MBN9278231.1 dihydrofolate reductase [Hyphomicrobium sp.]OJU23668.1 MAG: deaminase [Alphaproteobacteria bacterium 64-6]
MPTCHVYIAASLDGFIARPDGDIEWLHQWPDAGHDYGYSAFMRSVDGMIIGRGTFEKVLAFGRWPYDKPVVVLSRTLDPDAIPPDRADRVRIVNLAPEDLLERLAADGWNRAYVDGGRLIQSFLRAGLIADITITHIPILLGAGRSLFGALPQDVGLTHIETTSYPSGFVQSHYVVGRMG